MSNRIIHPCVYAEGNCGINAYLCSKKGCSCNSQFYCHNEKYWKPLCKIKCPDFKSEEQKEK